MKSVVLKPPAPSHLLSARVWPTLELVLAESTLPLRKRYDPDTVLALIDVAA